MQYYAYEILAHLDNSYYSAFLIWNQFLQGFLTDAFLKEENSQQDS